MDAVATPPHRRQVLIVYSWHDLMPWQAGLRAGLLERLQQAPDEDRPELFEERVDAGRIHEGTADHVLSNYLREKYARVPIDIVIAESQSAASLLLRYPDLFPGARQYAVNVAHPGNIPPDQAFVVREDPGQALLTIPRVIPGLERVVAVIDATEIGGRTKDGLLAAAASLPLGIQLDILEGFSFEELYTKAQNLPPRSALLYFPIFRDRTGAREIPRHVVSRLANVANSPIFAHHDSFLGTGIVGGYLISARRVGDLTARIALGLPLPKTGEEVDAAIKGYQFDERQLKRWNIADENLPVPNVVTNRTTTLWATYRWQIVGIVVALALETLLIAILVLSMRQRRMALEDLRKERALLEQRVHERTTDLAKNEAQLQTNLNFLSTILENEPECVKVVGPDGKLLQMNKAGLSMLEASSVEDVNVKGLVNFIVPEQRAEFMDLAQRIFEGESGVLEFQVQGNHGTQRWLDTHAAPLRDGKGNVAYLLAVTRDVTERKRYEAVQDETKRELETQLAKISELQQRLQEQVIRDPLTGLYNRRFLDETLPRELARAKRENYPIALTMIDLDYFKRVNDTYGHAAGDEVLKALAGILGKAARESDIICRWGGEEFLVALPGMSPKQALQRAEEWRIALAEAPVRYGDLTIKVTLSAGIAGYPRDGEDLETLLSRTDATLYLSKNEGRNRVTCFEVAD